MEKETLEYIKTVTSCLALLGVIAAIVQIRLNRKNIALNAFKSIYDDSIEVRKKFEKAKTQREILVGILNSYNPSIQDMTTIYASNLYDDLRDIGYFYEYLAILVNKKHLPFHVVFELIMFPDKFWDESNSFIKLMREKHYPDFWKNFETLRNRYIKERVSNRC